MTNSFPLVAAFAVAVGIGVVVTVKTAAPAVAIAPAPAQFLPPPPPPPQSFKELAKNSNEERHSREATPPALDLGPEEEVIVTEHPIVRIGNALPRRTCYYRSILFFLFSFFLKKTYSYLCSAGVGKQNFEEAKQSAGSC